MRLAVWSPLPPSASGIADYVAEQLPYLERHAEVLRVPEEPGRAVAADLHLYHLGNSPAHAYVYRAALERPGVAFLHDANLHHLVLHETVERGDTPAYLRQMRREHGERGSFVGRQVARALGGELLTALFPLSERVLEGSLAVVGLTEHVCGMAARRLPGRPVLCLPHHAWLPIAAPSRSEARQALGLDPEAFVLTAPGLATASKRLETVMRVVGRMARADPSLRLVIAGGLDPRLPLDAWAAAAGLGERLTLTGRLGLPDFVRYLAAADVVVALRFPSHGEMSGALMRALAVGRPVLVTSGSSPAAELPEGIVVPVDTGPHEEAQMQAVLERLRADAPLRDRISSLARDHAARHHDPADAASRLALFLGEVLEQKAELESRVATARDAEAGLLGYLVGELRGAARELGVPGAPLALTPWLRELVGDGA